MSVTFHEPTVLSAHTKTVSCFAVAGDRLISASHDGTIKVWGPDGCEISITGHSTGIQALTTTALSGPVIISGSAREDTGMATIRLWDFNGAQRGLIEVNTQCITALTVGYKHTLIAGTSDGEIHAWELMEGKDNDITARHITQIKCSPRGIGGLISPSEGLVLTASYDGSIAYWNLEGEGVSDVKPIFTRQIHDNLITSLIELPSNMKMLPSGLLLCYATGSYDTSIKVFNLRSQLASANPNVMELKGHRMGVRGLAVLPNSRMLVSCDGNNYITVWDEERTFSTRAKHTITAITALYDDSIALGFEDGTMHLLKLTIT